MKDKNTGILISRLMITCLLALLGSINCSIANGITDSFPKESLITRIEKVKNNTTVEISYDSRILQNINVPSLQIENATVEDVLKKTLKDTGLSYKKLDDNTFIILKQASAEKKKLMKEPGKLKGKITDEKGEPLPGANIFIVELKKGTVTDFNGNFILEVQPGSYTIEMSYISYQKQQITNLEIVSGKVTPLNVAMQPATTDLDEAVVTAEYKRESAAALYAIQKQTISLTDGISAEQIKQLPASNVAQVLKKVSGITVQNDKYVTVRGMSERYNNVQMNGSSLPSTEPNRRNFSFDIIPSNLIDNVVVYKTFTPDLPGEFSGGLVNVKTTSIPSKPFLSFSVGTGINTNSTGKDFYSTKRFSSDFFGGGDERTWFGTKFNPDLFFSDYNTTNPGENMRTQSAQIPNYWGLYKYTAQPVQSYSLSIGKPLEINANNTIGLITSLTYRHEEKIEDFFAKFRKNLGDTTNFAYNYKFNTSIGAVANMAWKNKNGHRINWRNLYNRRFSHTTIEQEISDLNEVEGALDYEYYSTVNINSLWQTRLDGKHNLRGENLVFDWFADYSKVIREQPDDRSSVGTTDTTTKYDDRYYRLRYERQTINPNSGMFLFSNKLIENKKNIGGNLCGSFHLLDNTQKIKTGYYGTFRNSEYDLIALKIINIISNVDYALNGLSDKELGNPEYFQQGRIVYNAGLTGATSQGQGYNGEQKIHAGYIMAELQPLKILEINGGVRMENETMDVTTLTREKNSEGGYTWIDTTKRYKQTEWLPSLTITGKIMPDLLLKAVYSKTLTRVDFKERSAFRYWDVEEKAFMLGNGGLESGYAKNYDLRLEWYPAPGEIISISGFYKKFMLPIELITYPTSSGDYIFMYFNLDDATTKGIELDFRKSFAFIYKESRFLKNLFFSGNVTLLEGNVTYNQTKLALEAQGIKYDEEDDDFDASRNRSLQGLSPYIINAGLNYQGKHIGAGINYNQKGRTLVLAATTVEKDEYDAPRNQLDAQLNARFFKQRMQVKFNISDVLAEDYIRYRNVNSNDLNMPYDEDPKGLDYNPDYDWLLKSIKKGTGYSISISYKF